MKPMKTDINVCDETQEYKYNCLTVCSICPGSQISECVMTGQCHTHLRVQDRSYS